MGQSTGALPGSRRGWTSVRAPLVSANKGWRRQPFNLAAFIQSSRATCTYDRTTYWPYQRREKHKTEERAPVSTIRVSRTPPKQRKRLPSGEGGSRRPVVNCWWATTIRFAALRFRSSCLTDHENVGEGRCVILLLNVLCIAFNAATNWGPRFPPGVYKV